LIRIDKTILLFAIIQSTTNYIHSEKLSNFLTKLKPTSTTNNENPGIDILLTHSLPQLLTVNSKVPPKDYNAPAWGCPPITEVLRAAQPRYHFSGGAVAEFWEREPWLWDPPPATVTAPTNDYPSVSRFVNLGQFGNEAKERVRMLILSQEEQLTNHTYHSLLRDKPEKYPISGFTPSI
jgi:hypothetical protein